MTMSAYPYPDITQARENFASTVSTLPSGYLGDNAAPLLRIIEELQKSFREELFLVQLVKNLDVTDSAAVMSLASYLDDYRQSRLFDRERTHCHNIQRIVGSLLKDNPSDPSVMQMQHLLQPLMAGDADFIDDLEMLVDRAVAAVNQIRSDVQTSYMQPTGYAPARATQATFTAEFGPRVDQLKALLKDMNLRMNELIDLS